MTRTTHTYKLTRGLYYSLQKRGVGLECSYSKCPDKRLKPGQTIVTATRATRHGSKTKRYHAECREKMYV